MKRFIFLLVGLSLTITLFHHESKAQQSFPGDVNRVAGNFILSRMPGYTAGITEPFIHKTDTVAWVVRCFPRGFIIIAARHDLPPVLAYSTEGNFGEGEAWREFLPVLASDLTTRIRNISPNSRESFSNQEKWRSWLNTSSPAKEFQQWPPEGSTSTGGWLETNWTQTAPYNNFCPVDGNTGNRSVAGCPATAMAQIVNYHKELYDTRFSDDDDYYHNFGSGNKYWIDNDWATYDFPSWDQLNVYLDTLEVHLTNGLSLKNDDKAALTYACGAAAKQVYSSSVSGTYGIDQAFDAFMRFGYEDSKLVYPEDTTLNSHLSENIKIGLPAQLGLVNPEETAGHNVVVDGYNTDEFYHFNFGWGGSANGWYTMPPASIPYNLTVIEGIVLDINLSHPPVGIDLRKYFSDQPNMWYMNESCELKIILPDRCIHPKLHIFDITGKEMSEFNLNLTDLTHQLNIRLNHLSPGIYFALLESGGEKTFVLKLVK